MRLKMPVIQGVGMGLLACAAVASLAHADLVYEQEISAQPSQQPSQQVEERDLTRQTLGVSERAQTFVQTQPAMRQIQAPATAELAQPASPTVIAPVTLQPTTQVAPAAPESAPASVTEVQSLSKAELMRRERMREELRNEDSLQERLEELRLRDEKRRTDTILTQQPAVEAAPLPPQQGQALVQEQVIVAPVTEKPGKSSFAAHDSEESDRGLNAISSTTWDGSPERTIVTVEPRGGVSNMNGNMAFDVRSHYSAGVGLGVGVGDSLNFTLGYQYSNYGVLYSASNPYIRYYQDYFNYLGYNSLETMEMHQNVIDLGLKLGFLGPDSRLRPFVSGGGGYAKSFTNFNHRFRDALARDGRQDLVRDYESSGFLGYLGTGFDIRVTRGISVGAQFRYHKVLTAQENESLNSALPPRAYGGYYSAYSYPYAAVNDPDKQLVGDSLARSSFYSILAGVSFAL